MCPLRFILVFLSATLAGFFLLRNFKSEPPPPTMTPTSRLTPKTPPIDFPRFAQPWNLGSGPLWTWPVDGTYGGIWSRLPQSQRIDHFGELGLASNNTYMFRFGIDCYGGGGGGGV